MIIKYVNVGSGYGGAIYTCMPDTIWLFLPQSISCIAPPLFSLGSHLDLVHLKAFSTSLVIQLTRALSQMLHPIPLLTAVFLK